MSALLEAVRNKSEEQAYHWSKSEGWATVEQLMSAAGNSFVLFCLSTLILRYCVSS